MKKRIFYTIIILSVTTSIVTGILSSLIYYNFYSGEAKSQLKIISGIIDNDKWSEYADIYESVENVLKSVDYEMRITLIDSGGRVIYDSRADYEAIGNHRDRPEIRDAFEKGQGEDTRFSNTLKSDNYYYAVRLPDSRVLRLSREIKSIRTMFEKIIPIIMFMFVFIIVAAFAAAKSISKKITSPLKNMVRSIDDLIDSDDASSNYNIYEELEPLKNKIREQKIKINEYIREIKRERDTIGILTENMKEGFILLDKNKKILSINTSGKHMAGNEKFSLDRHKDILQLTRNPQIISSIDTSINEKRHMVNDVNLDRLSYRYYFSPVWEKQDSVTGLMILIEDVTKEKKAEIMRREFSSNVSHELKTPLTTIMGFAEMIKEGLITDAESIKKYCGMINKEGHRLISLIDDIIRLSKIEEEIDADDVGTINLKETAAEVFHLLHQKSLEHDVDLILNAENISMRANRNYIVELIYNLADNGIKYNKKGGRVEININKRYGHINIGVRDDGMGIPSEHQERIFERFYRVDKSRSKETGGTGLGLSIVKHISELYKGSIELKSSESSGTEIIVSFPEVINCDVKL